MRGEVWKWSGAIFVSAISLTAFFGIALILDVVVSSVGSKAFSDWVEFLGGLLAISAAFMIGNQQSRATLSAVQRASEIDVARRSAAVVGVTDTLAAYAARLHPVFTEGGYSFLQWKILQISDQLTIAIRTLRAIPVHEVGNAEALHEFVAILTHAAYLEKSLKRALAAADEGAEQHPDGSKVLDDWVPFDGTVIGMNCSAIAKHAAALRQIAGMPDM